MAITIFPYDTSNYYAAKTKENAHMGYIHQFSSPNPNYNASDSASCPTMTFDLYDPRITETPMRKAYVKNSDTGLTLEISSLYDRIFKFYVEATVDFVATSGYYRAAVGGTNYTQNLFSRLQSDWSTSSTNGLTSSNRTVIPTPTSNTWGTGSVWSGTHAGSSLFLLVQTNTNEYGHIYFYSPINLGSGVYCRGTAIWFI